MWAWGRNYLSRSFRVTVDGREIEVRFAPGWAGHGTLGSAMGEAMEVIGRILGKRLIQRCSVPWWLDLVGVRVPVVWHHPTYDDYDILARDAVATMARKLHRCAECGKIARRHWKSSDLEWEPKRWPREDLRNGDKLCSEDCLHVYLGRYYEEEQWIQESKDLVRELRAKIRKIREKNRVWRLPSPSEESAQVRTSLP